MRGSEPLYDMNRRVSATAGANRAGCGRGVPGSCGPLGRGEGRGERHHRGLRACGCASGGGIGCAGAALGEPAFAAPSEVRRHMGGSAWMYGYSVLSKDMQFFNRLYQIVCGGYAAQLNYSPWADPSGWTIHFSLPLLLKKMRKFPNHLSQQNEQVISLLLTPPAEVISLVRESFSDSPACRCMGRF